MGNRPINRRPWRRPPWRKRTTRPTKWIEGNSHGSLAIEFCTLEGTDIACEPAAPRVVLAGDQDIEWADRDSVRVDRILGTCNVSAYYQSTSASPFTFDPAGIIVAFGMLCVEDTDNLFQNIDLFDRESVEEYEWMWLERRQMNVSHTFMQTATNEDYLGSVFHTLVMDWDIKTRRSLGKKDSIVLYSQFGLNSSFQLPVGAYLRVPRYHYELRTILRG